MDSTTEQRSKRPRLDSTLAAILAHPLRCKILTIMDTRAVSPNELSIELDKDLGTVSYHVRRLVSLDAIEQVATKRRRGATEHFYRAIERPMVSDEEFAQLSPEERQAVARQTMQLVTADAGAALEAGTFSRFDNYIVRIPGYVDEDGWRELSGIYGEAMEKIFDVLAASARRVGERDGAESFPVTSVLTFFEMPDRNGADAP